MPVNNKYIESYTGLDHLIARFSKVIRLLHGQLDAIALTLVVSSRRASPRSADSKLTYCR